MMFTTQEHVEVIATPEMGEFSVESECHRLFPFMKSALSLEALYSRAIPLDPRDEGPFSGFRLVPLAEIHADDSSVIGDLMDWRVSARFHGDDEIDVGGTKRWLRVAVLERKDRILFLVVDREGVRHGHLGLWMRDPETLELDNVIKSPANGVKGLMSSASQAIGRWANEFLGARQLSLRVASDNLHARNFYSTLGFRETDRLPFVSEDSDSEAVLDEELVHWIVMVADSEVWFTPRETILTAGPSIGPLEQALVADAVRSGWNEHHSDYLQTFSDKFSAYTKSQYSIPTDSCTSALHLALWALGVGPGDEVIVPEITWVATASAVRYVGATPIFADVDEQTWCISSDSVESLITEKTRAVIPVHLYGFVADIASIAGLCERYGLFMIQDAAPGIGAMYEGKSVAEFGHFTCFSFQGAKLLVTGEGGMLTTNDADLYKKAAKISDHGRRPGTFWIETLGKKIKMNNHTAALGLAQLYGAERQINKKIAISNLYRDELSTVTDLSFQEVAPDTRSIHWMTSIRVQRKGFDRDLFRSELLSRGIDTRPLFSPISRYPIWEQEFVAQPIAAMVGDNAINLPSGVGLTSAEIYRVASTIRELLS